MAKSKLFQNKFVILMGAAGLVVFALVAFVLLSATATTKAVVFIDDVAAGTTITDNIVKEINIPKATPGDFYRSIQAVLGEKTTVAMKKEQLIYPADLMSKIELSSGENANFVTTSIKVPNDNALGGLLTAGDVVDVSVVPYSGKAEQLARGLAGFNIDTSLDGGVYYILSNVTILNCTTVSSATAKSEENNNNSKATEDESAYYVISLSYNDYKKLRIAEQYGALWLNLAPQQNEENAPLIDDMNGSAKGGLIDAKKDPTQKQEQADNSSQNGDNNENNDKSNADSQNTQDTQRNKTQNKNNK